MTPNISIRQLQAFREVMRSGSVSEAARILGRTQPAVSALIANLEAELQLSLFRRQKGRLEPTPEAQFFAGEAEAILDRLVLSTRTMSEIGALTKGRLNIACMPAAANMLMPQLLGEFLRDKSDVHASLMMRASSTVTKWITSQQYDIGLAETPTPNPALDMQDFKLECMCAIPRDDPIAALDQIEAHTLDGKPMAALQEGHPNLAATKRAFDDQSAKFVQRFELRTFQPALILVEKGLCYCVCDPITVAGYKMLTPEPHAIVFRPFRPLVSLDVSILMPAHRPASKLANAFAQKLGAELGQLAGQE
ncbi:HTH-type transcriptional regulator CysL [Aliiroseovarius pelagivivens]|uniref:HTH-type transcriptional regulator CysL n=1 Tax=Aliiroseovarius pelagivivens TaxID=1639690 RepID=A0A2R8ATA5_9RHOB|nr:LysR family transcriptional regulator [Aliiroseovarius pelagivivens]SPF79117.1 HTH-type transcriptional regulator CysL [Aliiroseovarius pelagivivens]